MVKAGASRFCSAGIKNPRSLDCIPQSARRTVAHANKVLVCGFMKLCENLYTQYHLNQ